mmetsp:Transcript_5865/g.8605  ORF Transcript_5865/g.8605 Transcript_5865/m.8605 type:complete len:385 (-) Transcript_5865:165-1319(-)
MRKMKVSIALLNVSTSLVSTSIEAFSPSRSRSGIFKECATLKRDGIKPSSLRLKSALLDEESISIAENDENPSITAEEYQHKEWKLTYLYKPAAAGYEDAPPLVLLHPVGVGISSWFWAKLMASYNGNNPAIYAPDLIGCGLEHGADPWFPDEKGMFFPSSWVEGVETLIQTIALPNQKDSKSPFGNILQNLQRGDSGRNSGCTVVVQGGLAPVGVMLAARNPLTVSKLMLTSPPIYQDMITAVPQQELEKNYNFLKSPLFGPLAFGILENRGIIRFFSDLFLFADVCDEEWLDQTILEAREEARSPIQAFNAGLLQHRSFEEELTSLQQKTIVLSGENDKRESDRAPYALEMKRCILKKVGGCNVMPWENPEAVIEVIKDLEN